MRQIVWMCIGLLIVTALISGCTTSPPARPSTTPASVSTVQQAAVPSATTLSITGTIWKLGWYDDTKGVWSKVIEGSTITATFSTDGTISGSGGCTPYSAEYKLLASPGIWIRRPAVPETTCQTPTGVIHQQSVYYTDLEWAKTYAITNRQLLMFDQRGRKILQFDPA